MICRSFFVTDANLTPSLPRGTLWEGGSPRSTPWPHLELLSTVTGSHRTYLRMIKRGIKTSQIFHQNEFWYPSAPPSLGKAMRRGILINVDPFPPQKLILTLIEKLSNPGILRALTSATSQNGFRLDENEGLFDRKFLDISDEQSVRKKQENYGVVRSEDMIFRAPKQAFLSFCTYFLPSESRSAVKKAIKEETFKGRNEHILAFTVQNKGQQNAVNKNQVFCSKNAGNWCTFPGRTSTFFDGEAGLRESISHGCPGLEWLIF